MPADRDLPVIDAAALAEVVRNAAGRDMRPLGDWTVTTLVGGVGIGLGTYRVAGTGGPDGTPWSVVLKIVGRAGGSDGAALWDSWRREATAYRSALLRALPAGLAPPRCLAAVDVDDATTWLWLEDLGADAAAPWSLDDHAAAAGAFGELAGRHLDDPGLEPLPWLSRGWLRGWVAANAEAVDRLRAAADDPWVRRVWPGGEVDALLGLWAERERRLAVLERLPFTLCHFDVFRRNLHRARVAPGASGPATAPRLVVFDWAFVGVGAPGEDLVPLVLGNLAFGEVAPVAVPELERRALAAYLAGMRRAGWAGDERVVELGYAVAGTYRYTLGVLRLFLPFLLGDAPQAVAEQIFGAPFHEIAEATGILTSRHARRLALTADRLAVELEVA